LSKKWQKLCENLTNINGAIREYMSKLQKISVDKIILMAIIIFNENTKL
jgi:hypothetical protein